MIHIRKVDYECECYFEIGFDNAMYLQIPMCYPQNNKQDKIAKLNLAKQSGKHLPWHYKGETLRNRRNK